MYIVLCTVGNPYIIFYIIVLFVRECFAYDRIVLLELNSIVSVKKLSKWSPDNDDDGRVSRAFLLSSPADEVETFRSAHRRVLLAFLTHTSRSTTALSNPL